MSPLDDLFDDVAAYHERNPSSLKFPRVPLLDENGRRTGQSITREQYNPEEHEGRLGCPCCLTSLRAVGFKNRSDGRFKKQGSVEQSGYFATDGSLDNHDGVCPFGEGDSSAARRAVSMMQFLATPGRKRVNLNILYGRPNGEHDPGSLAAQGLSAQYSHAHPEASITRFKGHTGPYTEGNGPDYTASISVKSVKDLIFMANVIDNTDDDGELAQEIDFVADRRAISYGELVTGRDWPGLVQLTEMRHALGLNYPSFAHADLTKDDSVVVDDQHVFYSGIYGDENTDYGFYQVVVATRNPKVAEMINGGRENFCHSWICQ